jgi:hypothetical protein
MANRCAWNCLAMEGVIFERYTSPQKGYEPSRHDPLIATIGVGRLVRLKVGEILRRKLPKGEFLLLVHPAIFSLRKL